MPWIDGHGMKYVRKTFSTVTPCSCIRRLGRQNSAHATAATSTIGQT